MYENAKLAALKEKKKLEDATRAFEKASMSGVPAPVRTDPALAERIRAVAAAPPAGAFVMAPASFAVPEPRPPHDPAMDALVASVAKTTLAEKKAGLQGGRRTRRRSRRSKRSVQRNPKRKRA